MKGTESIATITTATFKREAPIIVGDFVVVNGVVTEYIGLGGAIEIPSKDGAGNPVTTIGEAAFKGIASITSVSIPSTVRSIGASAFKKCSSLESITIPKGVNTISKSAFEGCSRLHRMNMFE